MGLAPPAQLGATSPQTDTLAAPAQDHCKFLGVLVAAQDANALTVDEADIMDLTTLVTACALAVDPKIMHALIWHQSGGEPWSFTVAGVRQPQVFRDLSDAVDAAHDTYPADVAIRIGLTGLSATPRSVGATMFAPCSNITIAARQIAQLAERCKMSPHLNGDPIYCAIAAYRGSRERPDNAFADAVRTSVANNDAPDFEMPAWTDVNVAEVRSARRPAFRDTAMAAPAAPDDRERARLSPSFRSSPGRLSVRRLMMQQENGAQSRSKNLTFRVRVRSLFSHLLMVSSRRGQRSVPRHDRNDGISRNVA